MRSPLAETLGLEYEPLAMLFSDQRPDGALGFAEGGRGCVVSLFVAAARTRRVAAFSRTTCGCPGASTGLCFGKGAASIPGGLDHFLSTGRGEGYPEGERYKKTPEAAAGWLRSLSDEEAPAEYVVVKPFSLVDEGERPEVVCLFANPDQISALVVLANFPHPDGDRVAIPFGSGCQLLCLMPYHESRRSSPRAIIGGTDVTVRTLLQPDHLTFAAPWALFHEMEANVSESFLSLETWERVRRRTQPAATDAPMASEAREAMLDRADQLREDGRYEDAAGLYRQVLAEDAGCARAECGLGHCLLNAGEFEQALDRYQRAANLEPRNQIFQLTLGKVFCMLGEFDRAREVFDRADAGPE